MYKDTESDNKNSIGSAIQYFRDTYHISQSKLCKGLCSVSTLSRIEAGERDVDAFILETLLERLGKIPNQYELIVSDFDYEAYRRRTKIIKLIDNKAINEANKLIKDYGEFAAGKGSPHIQFILVCQANINELNGGYPETTIDILMEAISCTVPDFNTNVISDYFLSNSEFNIILDILHKMISLGMADRASKILDQIINYLYWHNQMEQNTRIYPKVAVIGGSLLLDQNDLDRALQICNKGIEMNKSSRRIDYLGELNLIKGQVLEKKYKALGLWETYDKEECVSLYLKAYHLFSFFDDITKAQEIRKHLQEEYKWVDID
jgi:transcriptional regulator with XRE-family HTH domain